MTTQSLAGQSVRPAQLVERFREIMRLHHYSPRTEEAICNG